MRGLLRFLPKANFVRVDSAKRLGPHTADPLDLWVLHLVATLRIESTPAIQTMLVGIDADYAGCRLVHGLCVWSKAFVPPQHYVCWNRIVIIWDCVVALRNNCDALALVSNCFYLCLCTDALRSPVEQGHFQMQDIAAYGAHFLLTVIGTEVDRNGNTLTVWSDGIAHPLNVAEACSGMRMLVAFLALGVFLAYTNLKGWWQRSLLVLCGVPIAILVNMILIASMGILTQYDQNFVDGEFHELVGVLWMLPALFFYMGTLWVVRNLIVDETEVKHAV